MVTMNIQHLVVCQGFRLAIDNERFIRSTGRGSIGRSGARSCAYFLPPIARDQCPKSGAGCRRGVLDFCLAARLAAPLAFYPLAVWGSVVFGARALCRKSASAFALKDFRRVAAVVPCRVTSRDAWDVRRLRPRLRRL